MIATALSNFIIKEGKLFVRTDGVAGESVCLKSGQKATFDTYYNSVSCRPFSLFTDIKRGIMQVDIEGEAEIEVKNLTKDNDVTIAKTSTKEGRQVIDIPFDMPSEGIAYLLIEAKGDVTIYGATFGSEEKGKDINIAIVICTFKREEYVISNVKKMVEHKSEAEVKYDVIVVDNGQTLTEADVSGAQLFKNKNLGGSGGFTRGIIEAYRSGKYTHILLMDDDITFFPQIIDRMGAFLSFAVKGNVAVGGGMLRLDKPELLHETGGLWDGDRIKGLYHNVDVSERNNILFDDNSADYSAWWCCCFPTNNVDKHGLPMPFFIKNDDVEYGVRSNFDWAFLNGVAVWHEPFDKKYSAHLEYYIKRNELITNCVTRQKNGFSQYLKLVRSDMWQVILQRYFVLPYLFMAYDDFFKGADYFSKIDGAELNSILLKMRPKTFTGAELTEQGYDLSKISYGKTVNKFLTAITLNGQLIPTPFYKNGGKDYAVTEMRKCTYGDTFMQKTVVHYNTESDTGFVTTLKRKEIFRTAFKLIKVAFLFLFRYRKVRADYVQNYKKITSFEAWEGRLW